VNNLAVLEKEEVLEETEPGESKRFAHFAEKVSVTEGYVLGVPVMAICGRQFVPSRDPSKFPVCPECREIMDALFISG
jgi:hypothetical protein